MSQPAVSIAKPATVIPDGMWVSFAGVAWVVVNVGLASLGIYLDWPGICAFVAGLVNGTLLGFGAVSSIGDRMKGGITGLLGGVTLSALRSDGSIVWKAMQALHGLIDSVLNVIGIEIDEKLHHSIEQEATYMIWTMLLVVLASLLTEWVRSARKPA